jgi:hypothetical protein
MVLDSFRAILHLLFCIYFGSVNHVRRDKSLFETGLDAAKAFLSLYTVAEIART